MVPAKADKNMRMHRDIRGIAFVGIVLTAAGVGCQEQSTRYPVSGRVLIDGKPLQTGSIKLVPESGRPVSSAIMSDGSFKLAENSLSSSRSNDGVSAGIYQVSISASKVIDEDAGQVEWLAPSKYADFRTSGLEVRIEGPERDLRLDLTWKGNHPVDNENKGPAKDLKKDQNRGTNPVEIFPTKEAAAGA
jgi:hypothetical protein